MAPLLHRAAIITYFVVHHVCVDSESEMMSPETDGSADEMLLSSIDKLSDACVMRYIPLVSCSVER